MDSQDLDIPFRLTAGMMPRGLALEISVIPDDDRSITVTQILHMAGLESLFSIEETFPAISNLSNVLSIYNATIGWAGHILPDYLRLGIEIDDWNVWDEVLVIENITVEIAASNMSTDEPLQLSLRASGLLCINGLDVETSFSYGHNTSNVAEDVITLQIASSERPLSLGAIIKHFFGENMNILPAKLTSLLDKTGIDGITFQVAHNDGRWSVSLFELAMSIHGTLDVFGTFTYVGHHIILIFSQRTCQYF